MTCAERRASIIAYVDGELAAGERAELEGHLAACPACREALAAEERLSARLAALPQTTPPGDFEARFWARIAREEAERERGPAGWLRRLFRPGGLAIMGGAAAAAFALAIALGRPAGDVATEDVAWQIAADPEDFELLQDPDLEIAQIADLLEKMERDPERGREPG